MAASASITVPVALGTPAQAYDARAIFLRTPGASAVSLDTASGKITFGYEFPGNIDRLVDRLAAKGLGKVTTVALDVPVRNIVGGVVNPAKLLAELNASPAVSNAAYDGSTVSATVLATTSALRYVYEEIIIAGLMPVDMPTAAGLQEFVL
jgi:hypothetical protein